MILGALVDAGAPLGAIQQAIDAVIPGSVVLTAQPVTRGGQRATKVRVNVVTKDVPHRLWRTVRTDIEAADLPPETKARALAVFERLARVEGRVHGIDPEEVHFHEVGALDSIADVVGSCEALRLLGVATLSSSPVSLGSGRIRAAHGDIAVPVPAVAELAIGWQVLAAPEVQQPAIGHHDDHGHDEHVHDHDHGHEPGHPHSDSHVHAPGHAHEPGHAHVHVHDHSQSHSHDHDCPAPVLTPGFAGELATPTGLALVRALAGKCESMPSMTVGRIGVGAGGRDIPGRPNVVRVILAAETDDTPTSMVEIMANVDDLDPRLWPGVIDAVLAAGARDAWLVPITMKKGRPAFTLHTLVAPKFREAVTDIILTHTSTLGVRDSVMHRSILHRQWRTVLVNGIEVSIKIGTRDGVIKHATAEFDSLTTGARQAGVSEYQFGQLVHAAMAQADLVPGRVLR